MSASTRASLRVVPFIVLGVLVGWIIGRATWAQAGFCPLETRVDNGAINNNWDDLADGVDENNEWFGGGGQDTLRGHPCDDIEILGEAADDDIGGGSGGDNVRGGTNRDIARGGQDNDTVQGGNGNDIGVLDVESDDVDNLEGNSGDDFLDSVDGDNFDDVHGGPDSDDCNTNSGDTRTSCNP